MRTRKILTNWKTGGYCTGESISKILWDTDISTHFELSNEAN